MKKILSFVLAMLLVIGLLPVMAVATGNDAKIGSTEYATLQIAISAVQNDEEITVIDDITCGTPITINNGKTFTINFKDGSTQHTFTWLNDQNTEHKDADIFTISHSSNVTVKNMQYKPGEYSEQDESKKYERGNRIFKVNSTGTLTLKDMKCDKEDNIKDTPVVNNGGIVIIDGGNITTTNVSELYLLNPIVQNLGGTTTFTGNGTYTMQNNNTGAVWIGNVITTPDKSTYTDRDSKCGTVIIENGTFNGGHIVDVNGKGNITINNATYGTGNGPIIKTYLGGVKSNITVKNITASTSVFAQVLKKLNKKINFENGNMKYTPGTFCIDISGSLMTSVSIKNGKFGPKTGTTDIHDEIEGFLTEGATITALSGDSDGYTYKVELSAPPTPEEPEPERRSYTTVTIGDRDDKEKTKADEKAEENPDTGAPVMSFGAVAVVLGAAYVISKKH